MKVLLSAVACNPYLGSENYVGWAAVKALAREHELWVLTGRRGVADLRRAAEEGLVPENVHFVHAGVCQEWHPNRLRARLQGWREYVQFSQAILPVARQLHDTVRFDVAHHVTYVTWRVASPLWQLGIPFVFGPVGGYELFPPRLFPILSPAAAVFEMARMASNLISRSSPRVRRCLREASHVFAANLETERLVQAVCGAGARVSRLMGTFHTAARMVNFSRFAANKDLAGPLRLFAGGNLEGRKGVALALEALAVAKKNGVSFQYLLGGQGPETGHLKQLCARLQLNREVIFGDGLRGEAYAQELGRTHIYLLPSLRDNAPVTLEEAMLAGCVPVVAAGGGADVIVAEGSGYRIPVTHRRQMVRQLAEIIISLDRNRRLIAENGRAASAHIAAQFSEDHYRNTIYAVYQAVTNTARNQ